MKIRTVLFVCLVSVSVGYGLSQTKPLAWPGAVSKWWSGPPSGSSELTIAIDDALKDASAWTVVKKAPPPAVVYCEGRWVHRGSDKEAEEYHELPLERRSEWDAITNGKIVFLGASNSDKPLTSTIHMIRVGGVDVGGSMTASEKLYLFEKARKIYRVLRNDQIMSVIKE